MTDDNIIEFPFSNRDESESFFEDYSEIKQIYADITLSLMKMNVCDGDTASTALAIVALSILKGQNMSNEEIENFGDVIFGNKNY